MTVALMEVYDALKDAGVADDKARRVAEAMGDAAGRASGIEVRLLDVEKRLDRIEVAVSKMQAELGTIRWVLGLNTALVAGVLLKLFIH